MTKRNRKVVITQKIFANYRKPIYDLIGQQVDLLVLHGHNNSGIQTISANYSKKVPTIQYRASETALIMFPLYQILRFRPQVVILEFALGLINLPFIILVCKMFGIKCAFWSHGYDRKKGFHPKNSMADKYRLFLMKFVDANIVYGQEDKAVLKEYINKSEIFVAQNTVDTNAAFKIKKKMKSEGRKNIKDRLKIKHETNLIFIGRMIPAKRPELLIEMYELLKSEYNITIGVQFIGDGPMLEIIKGLVQEKSIEEDFYFHGASYDAIKNGELLFVSDLMVMPSFVGLSVNHALCFDCPVMTFEKMNGYPTHGPEVEYVVHNKTGFLLKDHSASAMAAAAYKLFSNENLKSEFQENIQFMATEVFPMEKMVGGVIDCVDYLTEK